MKRKWDKTFSERIDVYYDELKWLYSELYNNDMQGLVIKLRWQGCLIMN